ncbi:MAG: glycoside hydrolase family 78 protein [Oscillospiraceae bacterium]|jgi:alpha-L-rhamnosidase|nr:glycoside hydrolase family 78 protein [Oscillospiraceae bacterium]
MNITKLKTGHITSPLGFETEQAVFSWVTEDTPSKKQAAARVEVSADDRFSTLLFDSGKSGEVSSLAFAPDIALKPRTRYFWRVTVWGDAGDSATSETAWFETGKMEEKWDAEWITPDWEDKSVHPYLRRSFVLPGNVKSARVYATGMGLYHLEINGSRAGSEYLTPYFNAYNHWVQYQTYDVTGLLRGGENVIGAMLGNGWAKGRFGLSNTDGCNYTDRFSFLCELRACLEDGSEFILGTDGTWKAASSPVTDSSIYDGETFDAGKIRRGWSEPAFDDSTWEKVKPYNYTLGKLTARLSPPVVIKHVLKPAAIIKTPKGETVLDVGQNMTGWLRFKANVPKGTKLSLYHGEVLQEDCFYNENLRSAKAEYHYISDGTPTVCEPLFTFYGFRYVKLEGWPSEPDIADFEACVVYSDLEQIGNIETSSPKVNRLFLNALWGQRGNFLDVPTDCPQRDERMGWTGDAQVFSGTASFNMDTYAFYAKYLHDMYQEQLNNNGYVPDFVPNIAWSEGSHHQGNGSCAWADAACVIPWEVYLHTGDKSILERQFDSMCGWVDYVTRTGAEIGGKDDWLKGFHYGDWLALDNPDPTGYKGATEDYYLAAVYYAFSSELTSKAAAVLGKTELSQKYADLSQRMKSDIRNEYFTSTGRMALTNQTAYVTALYMDVAKKEHRPKVLGELKKRLEESGMHLKTGFIGTPYLCRVLSDNGASDYAYRLFLNEDYPSWLYEVNMGATTVWERWNSVNPDGKISSTGMNSLNHYAYGSIAEWMYRNMCGINPCEDEPGFKKAVIRPQPNGALRFAKASLDSAMGLYESGWKLEDDGSLVFDVTVPFGAEAELLLPDAKPCALNGADGLAAVQTGNAVSIALEAGKYHISYMPTKKYLLAFDLETPIDELLFNADARKVLEKHIPEIVSHGAMMKIMGVTSLNVFRANPMTTERGGAEFWDMIEKELSDI